VFLQKIKGSRGHLQGQFCCDRGSQLTNRHFPWLFHTRILLLLLRLRPAIFPTSVGLLPIPIAPGLCDHPQGTCSVSEGHRGPTVQFAEQTGSSLAFSLTFHFLGTPHALRVRQTERLQSLQYVRWLGTVWM
jgi:hypothetical protein